MKLFKISQIQRTGYDTFDSAVVCACDVDHARQIHPFESIDGKPYLSHWSMSSWCSSPDVVIVEYIGEAAEGLTTGVVLASFHAG